MHLEEIRMYGFKTFKDEVRIVLSPKISCIVGPNGSGKSNVVDAVRWALGEHRLSILRAKETSDLIFSGSAFKKPLSVASVKLIFNNEDHKLPIKTPRVIIERRLYRPRETHYFVNNEEKHLQDVMELLYAAGIYGQEYAIIGQGKIEELLLARPEQKKSLIDRVAGVEVFKKRKKEALRKLEETEENLTRVRDRFNELKKLVTRVSTEAKKAHLYYTMKDRLNHLEDTLLNSEIQQFEKEVVFLQAGIDEVNKDLAQITKIITEKKKEETNILKEEESLKGDKDSLRNKNEKLLIEKTRLLEKERYLTEKKDNLLGKIESIRLEQENRKRKINFLLQRREELANKKEQLEALLQRENEAIEEINKNISIAEQSINPLVEAVNKEREAIETIRQERLKKEKLLSAIETDIKYTKQEISELENNIQNIDNLKEMDIVTIKNRIDTNYSEKKSLEARKKEIEEKIILLKYEIKQDRKFIAERSFSKKEYYRENMLGNLLNVKENIAGISEELRMQVLQSKDGLTDKKKGRFFIKEDLLDITEQSADEVKPISFVTNKVSKFLKGIYIAENLNAGRSFFRKYYDKIFIRKIITKDGFVLYSPFEVWIKTNIIVQEKMKELKNKEALYVNMNKTLEKINENIFQINRTISLLQKEKEKALEIASKKNKALKARKRLLLLRGKLNEKLTEKERIKKEIQLLLSKTAISEKEKLLNDEEKKIQSLKKTLQEKILKLTEEKYKVEKISDELNRINAKVVLLNREVVNADTEQEKTSKELTLTRDELHGIEKSLQRIALDIKTVQDKSNAIKDESNEIAQKRKKIAVELMRFNEQKEELLKKMEKQRIAIAEKNARIEGIKNTMEEKEIKRREILYDIDEKKIKTEIKELKRKMQSLGAIDFTSLNESEKLEEELKEKETTYRDVLNSKKKIEKFIKETDKRIKDEFESTLNKVDKLFSGFFKKMFQGGEANIDRFYDDNDEVSGIEFNVRMPGKRKQSLPLLSGGEKTLTALAFLFAILKVKPALFYIFDEVDAALDEDNVIRFGNLLEEESRFSQFIVITHNKETMQKADILYGITMEDDGVSKMISLKMV